MKLDNVIFGKEIKDLNILTNPNADIKLMLENSLGNKAEYIKGIYRENFNRYRDRLKTNIKYITRPIVKAWKSNENKLVELMPRREDRGIQYGVYIYKPEEAAMLTTNYFYMDLKNMEVFYACLYKGQIIDGVVIINNQVACFKPYRASEMYEELSKGLPRPELDMDSIDINLELDWLIKHMDLQIAPLKGRGKVHVQDCIYENHTNNDIEVVTSAYFHKLEKTGAFNVRGHFRWQPKKKDGEWTKEVIWINDFQKEGYTAPARKLVS